MKPSPKSTSIPQWLKGSDDSPLLKSRAEQIEAKMMQHLGEEWGGFERLSRELYISYSTMKRAFKERYGISMGDYYRNRKMELAKEKILAGEKVTNVAYILGYNKVSAFIFRYKSFHGCTPGADKKTKSLLDE